MDFNELTLADLRAMDPESRGRALDDLVQTIDPRLSDTAFRILHDRHLSEDVCQDAWLLLCGHLSSPLSGALLNGRSAPRGPIARWLTGVVTKKALKALRHCNVSFRQACMNRTGVIGYALRRFQTAEDTHGTNGSSGDAS
jgi:DNA-directed RNA polymerase specialized sigma24 family protein